MISERSTVTTVRPEACSSFSLKRIVWKAPVRAPIEPTRAFFRPRTTRQTRDEAVEIGGEFLAVDVARCGWSCR